MSIDFETTNQNKRSVCSIGLIKVPGGKKVDEFYSLINPEDYFDTFNILIYGISVDMVQHVPTCSKIKDNMFDFIDGLPVVANNAPFDTGVIRDANNKYGLDL